MPYRVCEDCLRFSKFRRLIDTLPRRYLIAASQEGAFYVEISSGHFMVQPFEYYDRDAVVYVDAETLLDTLAGSAGG